MDLNFKAILAMYTSILSIAINGWGKYCHTNHAIMHIYGPLLGQERGGEGIRDGRS